MPPPTFTRTRTTSSAGDSDSANIGQVADRTLSSSTTSHGSVSSSDGAPRSSNELHVRPQIVLRNQRRWQHTNDDATHARQTSGRALGLSSDARRHRADASKRLSIDSWGSLLGKAADDAVPFSPRASSPGLDTPIETEDWWSWSRRRLSSVTSLGSVIDAKGPHSDACLPHQDVHTEDRTEVIPRSPSALDRSHRPRPLSMVSIASIGSATSSQSESSSAAGISTSPSALSASTRRRLRSGRLRRELLTGNAVAPQVDLSVVQSFSSSTGSYRPIHSPISEAFDPSLLKSSSTTSLQAA